MEKRLIGNARVSTLEQELHLQLYALKAGDMQIVWQAGHDGT
jgi:hypothetical protein